VCNVGGDGARIKLQGAVRRSRARRHKRPSSIAGVRTLAVTRPRHLNHTPDTHHHQTCLQSGRPCLRTSRNEAATTMTTARPAQTRATSGAEWPGQHLRPPQPHPAALLDRRCRQIMDHDQAAKIATLGQHLRQHRGLRVLSGQLHHPRLSMNDRQTHPKTTQIQIAVTMTLGLHLLLPAQVRVTTTTRAWGNLLST
jgi:hypothetical protein